MQFRTLGVYASLALAANSVLIPPNVGLEALGESIAIETLGVNPFHWTVQLKCGDCMVVKKEDNVVVPAGRVGNNLLLHFEIDHDANTLNLEGVKLYPPVLGEFPKSIEVRQDPRDFPEAEEPLPMTVTGYTLHFDSASTVTEAGTELIPLTFRIFSLNGETVHPPNLTIYLLKDTDGRLMIASFTIGAAEEASPKEETKECKEWPMLCKWKSILSDKINGIKSSMSKGCHKHKGNPMTRPGTHGKPPHRFRPGVPHPHHPTKPEHQSKPHHHHGGHHHRHHGVMVFLRRAFFTVLIPILIGIFVGAVTYLIGMALGCAIAIVIAKISGRPAYLSVAQDEEPDVEDETRNSCDKEVYTQPPEYDAPPEYQDAVEKEVVDEAH